MSVPRGSLRRLVPIAYDLLSRQSCNQISILRNTTGKYYILLTPPDYDRYHDKVDSGDLSLVLQCNAAEIHSMLSSRQPDLFSPSTPAQEEPEQ